MRQWVPHANSHPTHGNIAFVMEREDGRKHLTQPLLVRTFHGVWDCPRISAILCLCQSFAHHEDMFCLRRMMRCGGCSAGTAVTNSRHEQIRCSSVHPIPPLHESRTRRTKRKYARAAHSLTDLLIASSSPAPLVPYNRPTTVTVWATQSRPEIRGTQKYGFPCLSAVSRYATTMYLQIGDGTTCIMCHVMCGDRGKSRTGPCARARGVGGKAPCLSSQSASQPACGEQPPPTTRSYRQSKPSLWVVCCPNN